MPMRWRLLRLLVSALLVLQGWALAQAPEDPARWLSAYQTLSKRLLDQVDKREARKEAERILEDATARHGNESAEAGVAMAALADVLDALAEHDQSLQLRLRLLQIVERFAPDLPITADVLNGLAGTYSLLKKHEQALPLYLRALRIREQADGTDQPSTAPAVDAVATAYWSLGKYDLALPLQRRLLT